MSNVYISSAAEKLARQLDIKNFKVSDGWLWRFRNHHGISNKKMSCEAGSTDTAVVDPFRLKVNKLIKDEDPHLNQIHNGEEVGLF